MKDLSIQNKEELIVGTVLGCIKEINKMTDTIKIASFNKLIKTRNNLYHFNMEQLYREINPTVNLNENFEIIHPNHIVNSRNNHYAYLQKVNNFVNNFEPKLVKSLNENFSIEDNKAQPTDFFTFNKFLKKIISELEKINEIDKTPSDILKIKITLNKPILVYGYDICNNLALKNELREKFNLTSDNLLSICYDKLNSQLLFIPTDLFDNIICYDLKKDVLDLFNNINTEKLKSKIEKKSYFDDLKKLLNNNTLVEVYKNIELYGLKFTDNLYNDIKFNEYVKTQTVVKR
jgi:hypothetical protein